MLSYCLNFKKKLYIYIYIYTESINPKISATSNGKTMILSKCAIFGSKIIKIY